jgi:hemolysin D
VLAVVVSQDSHLEIEAAL